MDILHTDILILGSGLTAWMAAHTLLSRRECRVTMVSDGAGASPWVHGFNVPLHPEDSMAAFYEDTRRSGYRQNDPALVHALCEGSPAIFEDVQALGAAFNRMPDGSWQLLRPLGSSHPRVASIGNETGPAIMTLLKARLAENPNFTHRTRCRALRLMTEEGRVSGALCWDRGKEALLAVSAGTVLLCMGGYGRIWPFSTNKADGGGDGVAMAHLAGADAVDMEFIQFEPSAAVYPDEVRGQGMITTLFYEGAVLKNALDERFMLQYGEAGERRDKDVLARCIAKEIQEGRATPHGGVWFDATGVDPARLEEAYPAYVARYRRLGIELSETPIELAPAPHTTLGGVRIDADCHTTVPGLLAAGEVAGGLHGANRVGGNAGLETLVYGKRAGHALAEMPILPGADDAALTAWVKETARAGERDIGDALQALRAAMADALQTGAYVLRNGEDLHAALDAVRTLRRQAAELPDCRIEQVWQRIRLENDLITAEMTLLSALERRESVGCHIRTDCPEREARRYRVHVRQAGGDMLVSREDWNDQTEEA